MVTSPSNTRLLHASPSAAVAGTGDVGRTGTCVDPATGVLTNEKVGSAAGSRVGEAPARVGNSTVGMTCVLVAVFVGAASAVWVDCTESWATVVPTIAVLSALISWVGAAVAPTLQDVKSRAAVSKTSQICRVDLLENIIVTSISEWLIVFVERLFMADIQFSLYCNAVCSAEGEYDAQY
jgi:hypothetical protein